MQKNLFRASIEYLKDESKKILVSKTPERVALFLSSDSLGGFVSQNIVAAWAVCRFPTALVFAAYKNDAEYKSFITDCNPHIHSEMKADPDSAATLLVDWFDIGQGAPVKCPSPEWKERKLNEPDIILLPTMLSLNAAHLPGLEALNPALRIPAGSEGPLFAVLEAAGVGREGWFACIDLGQEAGDIPKSYLSLINHITEDQGGQVVRVGLPDGPSLPEIDGLIDLSAMSESFSVQATAISRARYFIGVDSGMSAVASAFRTPAAAIDVLGYANRVWNKGDIVLTKRIYLPDGTVIGTRDAFDGGLLDKPLPVGARAENNAEDKIIAVAGHMHQATADCLGWRDPVPEPKVEEAPGYTFPVPLADRPLITFWD